MNHLFSILPVPADGQEQARDGDAIPPLHQAMPGAAPTHAHQPTGGMASAPSFRGGSTRFGLTQDHTLRRGLNAAQEYSTGYALSPTAWIDAPLLPERRRGRMSLAAVIALVSLLVIGLAGAAVAFASGQL